MRATPRYCDVALPVPLDRLFTYEIPMALEGSVQPGCRVSAPLGSRKLTGVVFRLSDEAPPQPVRLLLAARDLEPVLDAALLALGSWIAEYYCAPIGEVLRGMLPLAGETRRGRSYALTDIGRDAARQLVTVAQPDPAVQLLTLLETRARPQTFLTSKVAGAQEALRGLLRRGWITLDETEAERDPLRARADRLIVTFRGRPAETLKLKKSERELLSFLELHPGSHNVGELGGKLKQASEAARSLARRELVAIETADLPAPAGYARPRPVLHAAQEEAFATIDGALAAGEFRAFLLEGVTGSGKTEVYLRSIESALSRGKNALLLVPEIALTPAVAGQFFHRFGKQVAILHSAFGESERADQWRRVRSGQARVIVGTRSGVFAPVRNLGLLVVDEEHDTSYKQAETPRYHARDVALVRAANAGAVAILGSATPSIESRYNAERGKYTLLRLPERIGRRPLPTVEIVDMRLEFLETKQQATFSRKLLAEIAARLEAGEQTMLLMNRRGFSSFLICRACGERMQCENCSVTLTHHRRDRRMLCHICSYAQKIPETCPRCASEYIQFLGTGAERVEDELHTLLPTARIARLDRDSASGKGAFERILHAFRDGKIDILVGTQMIAKGHDIPNVTLVGIVLADIGLSLPDFRAAERSFQLLTQAAGRAGRGDTPGRVLIQTLNPDHYAVRLAAEQNYEAFYRKEIEFRRWLRYPPFASLANVLVRAEKQEEALRMATQLGYLLNPPPAGVRVMGPAEAPVLRVRGEYRYQILVKAARRPILRQVIGQLRALAQSERWKATALVIDVDPVTLL